MKRKLTTADIAGYFPYGLYVVTPDKTEPMFHVMELRLPELLTLEPCDEEGATKFSDDDCGIIDLTKENVSNARPILRPLSDLYERITHRGESFIPMVRLAKIAFPEDEEWEIIGDSCVSENSCEFCFEDSFCLKDCGDDVFTCSQVSLFDLLNEWKIDYRGLILAGLAVDVNTLKINPYA